MLVLRSFASRRAGSLRSCCSVLPRRWSSSSSSSSTAHDPLRILFCGADQFSIYSLQALDKVRLEHPDKVASIDVVCKKDKRVGRGLKKIQEVPIKNIAIAELDLPVHQIDTFTGWEPPRPNDENINLIIAVSFGLLVPPRILNVAKYGGLNVHPSMLPDLRGPAPLHHTLLRRLQQTGVTLQTLHPKHFDQGRIVDQTLPPGLAIPSLHSATPDSLLQFVGPLGAEMLARNILTGDFAKPVEQHRPMPSVEGDASVSHASKITPEDRRIRWQNWTTSEFNLRDRVLGRTWADAVPTLSSTAKSQRVTFQGWRDATDEFIHLSSHHQIVSFDRAANHIEPGVPVALSHDTEKRIFFPTSDAGFVSPDSITIEGKSKVGASTFYQYGIEQGKAIDNKHGRNKRAPIVSTSAVKNVHLEVDKSKYEPVNVCGITGKTSHTSFLSCGQNSGIKARSFSTCTTFCSPVSNPSHAELDTHARVDWSAWTLHTFLQPHNQSAYSKSRLLRPLHSFAPPGAKIIFHDWTDSTRHYRKIFYRGSELYTPLPHTTHFGLGAPFFLSRDPERRLFFWVWADAAKQEIRVVSPTSVSISGVGKIQGSDLYDSFMAGKKDKVRLVTLDEVNRFHASKAESHDAANGTSNVG